MIASCPECQTRYRVADDRIGPQGARIRCQKCQAVFAVEPPAPTPELEAQPIEYVASALVAEASADTAKAIAGFLESWGVEVKPLEDGADALLTLHRDRFDFAILGAGLPGIQAPAICEILRRNADLQEMSLVRILGPGEVPVAPEFDADLVLDSGDLPDALRQALENFGVGREPSQQQAAPSAAPGAPSAPKAEPAVAPPTPKPPAPEPTPTPAAAPAAPEPKTAADSGLDPADPDVKAAERLARIVVSDIILYNEDKFATAAAAGNAPEALAAELEEAGRMFVERVSEDLRAKRDFLVEELQRRAAKKLAS